MSPRCNHAVACMLVAGLLVAASSMAGSEPGDVAYAAAAANPGYDEVVALPHRPHDARITYGDHPDQFGLLWLPHGGAPTDKATIVLVHGGCWLNAYDMTHTRALATALAGEGYPVWNLEYRRADETSSAWPTSLEDLQRGMSVMGRLARQGLNTDHVIIVGHSAGGHLALLLAAYSQQGALRGTSRLAVVGLAAITDIVRYAGGGNSCQQAAALFMGGKPDAIPERYAAANPAALRFTVPVILLRGYSDKIVPDDQHEGLQGENITGILEPEAGHFDWVHPGTPAFKTLLQALARLQGDD